MGCRRGSLREYALPSNWWHSLLFQYLYWKQMAKAATVIQTKYRTYCEHKRFKKSQEVAAMCIQNYYRTYKEHQGGGGGGGGSKARSSRESTPTTGLKWVVNIWILIKVHTGSICNFYRRSGLSTWKYQFSYDHWSQAMLSSVSTWMGDCSSVAWVLLLTLKVG